MNSFAFHENKPRGMFDFPIEYYYVDRRNPQYVMPFHWHMESELIYIRSGEFKLTLDEDTFILKEGDVAFVAEGRIHGGIPEDCIYECLVFDFSRIFNANTALRGKLKHISDIAVEIKPFFNSAEQETDLIKAVFDTMKAKQQAYEIAVVGLLWQFAAMVIQNEKYNKSYAVNSKTEERTEQIKNALYKIRDDYNKPLTLNELSAKANLSPKYFCRAFKEITGKTPVQYLNFYRIECACDKLLNTPDSIFDIALSCGFNDLSYFIKLFKRQKGVSPKHYRQTV